MADMTPLKDRLEALAQAAKRQQAAADQAARASAPVPAPAPVASTIIDQRGLPPG